MSSFRANSLTRHIRAAAARAPTREGYTSAASPRVNGFPHEIRESAPIFATRAGNSHSCGLNRVDPHPACTTARTFHHNRCPQAFDCDRRAGPLGVDTTPGRTAGSRAEGSPAGRALRFVSGAPLRHMDHIARIHDGDKLCCPREHRPYLGSALITSILT